MESTSSNNIVLSSLIQRQEGAIKELEETIKKLVNTNKTQTQPIKDLESANKEKDEAIKAHKRNHPSS